MRLPPIAIAEPPTFINDTAKQYADQKSEMGAVPPQEAREQAERESAALFPTGQLQPSHSLTMRRGL